MNLNNVIDIHCSFNAIPARHDRVQSNFKYNLYGCIKITRRICDHQLKFCVFFVINCNNVALIICYTHT